MRCLMLGRLMQGQKNSARTVRCVLLIRPWIAKPMRHNFMCLPGRKNQVVNSSRPCGNLQLVRDLLVPVPFAEGDMQEILQQILQIWRVWTLVEEKLLMLLAHPGTDLQA